MRGLQAALRPYVEILRQFVRDQITADVFEVHFNRLYRADTTAWPDDVFDVLDGFFADVDAYVPDPQLIDREGGDLDAAGLRERAIELLRKGGADV